MDASGFFELSRSQQGLKRSTSSTRKLNRPLWSACFYTNVAPSFRVVTIRYPAVQPHAPVDETCRKCNITPGIEFADVVDVSVCWDADGAVWGV